MGNEHFTKGKWEYIDSVGEVWCGDELICATMPTGSIEYEANAALIAAAPDMYEMLKTACGMFSGTEFSKRAEALLAKARGEA